MILISPHRLLEIRLPFTPGTLNSRGISVSHYKVGNVSDYRGPSPDKRVASDAYPIRDACPHADGRAFADFHQPSRDNAGREAREIVQLAVVVDQNCAYLRYRSPPLETLGLHESPRELQTLSRSRPSPLPRRMDAESPGIRASVRPSQIGVNFSPPPIIADCDHCLFRSVELCRRSSTASIPPRIE